MTDESRLVDLLERILESGCSPELACEQCPELLPEVIARLKKLRSIEDQVDELFPSSNPGAADMTEIRRRSPRHSLPHLEGYDIEGILGHGGMGVVYRALHLNLKRTVALKMLLSGVYASPQELARFRREAEAVASLQHPNIVQVHDVGELEGRPFFTMEFVDAGSLSVALGGAPMAAGRSAALLATIATAVAFAHQHGILHRDLKPANILLTADGTPKINDFGLARRIEGEAGLTQSGVLVGTPSYMSPEQATGQTRSIGPAADIYALGAILYEMLTGRPPFRSETSAETLLHVIHHEPASPRQLNPKIPRDLETICLKCLNKDPANRYASAADLADDLNRFIDGRPIVARPLGLLGRIWRWCRRNPSAAFQLATAMALVGLVLGALMMLERQRADHRAETAREEGHQSAAIESALEKATTLQEQGRWLEARATLDGAQTLLRASVPIGLRVRLGTERANAEMVAQLEEIRLRLSDGRTSNEIAMLSPEKLYGDAFMAYGISIIQIEPEEAAKRIRNSPIREKLLTFLHDWLLWASKENRGKLRETIDRADDDAWRREFRDALMITDIGKLKKLARAKGVLDQPPVIISGLGGELLVAQCRDEALSLLRDCQQEHPSDFWINFLLGNFWGNVRPLESVGYYRAAVAIRPSSDQAYTRLGQALRAAGDVDGAITAFRKSIALNANYPVGRELARVLAGRGDLEEARVAWEKYLEREPSEHDSWYGYAQLCLFLGHEEKYHKACEALLSRFVGPTDNWAIFERVSLACLLRPDSENRVKQAVEFADRAVGMSGEPANPYLGFLKGLALYRQGRAEESVRLLRDSADKLPNRAGPRLALAMAQFQAGTTAEARKTLATAVRNYNWNGAQATHTTVWTSHVLRREAESKILPNLSAFLQGTYQPNDNDERVALLGICQSQKLNVAASRLYAEAFAADPGLSDELTADCIRRATREGEENFTDRVEALNTAGRYLAARSAALAGFERVKESSKLEESERARWREQARQWLRADYEVWTRELDSDSRLHRSLARAILAEWQTQPDFAGIRDPDAIRDLSAEEIRDCLDLWNNVGRSLDQRIGVK